MRRPLIAGNWKLHKTEEETRQFAAALLPHLGDESMPEVMIAPVFTALAAAREAFAGSPVQLGAQNCYPEAAGAFTGEVSAPLLRAAGCRYVIIGHSERRQYFQESDAFIRRKLLAAMEADLQPILCLGESLAQREAGETEKVLGQQLAGALEGFSSMMTGRLTLAYEPIWAIGTGRTASPEQAQNSHAFLRGWLSSNFDPATAEGMRLLYGGSVKPGNVAALMSQQDIDGALVGGASLDADDFLQLIRFRDR